MSVLYVKDKDGNFAPINTIKGEDGHTPHIGDNGNWWIGDTDTEIRAEGKDGKDGDDGKDGKDGYTPQKGVDYFDGKDGTNGIDGKTPEKGVDYFTEADKYEMVQAVLSALPDNREVAH